MPSNILIVDDSATTRSFLKRAITLSGVPVEKLLEAENGAKALVVIASQRIDLIVTDLHMPEMDGVEMIARLHADPATGMIPVVVVTADPNCDRIDQLKLTGVRGVIRKPFTPESVRDALNQVLGVAHA